VNVASTERTCLPGLEEEKIGVGLTMPTAWRYGSPGAMPSAAVNAFNSLIHTIASQSESAWSHCHTRQE
jgi:hypothetical protein